jgi:hypothetical protein
MNKSPAPVQSEASESCGNRIDSSILHFFLLAALCGTLYFPYLGSTPFFDKGEPREALAVQDIVQRGEWLVPLKRATDIPSKPQQLLYFVVWFGAVFIFFSAATQKRPVYILSLYPTVALLLGVWWQKLKDNRSESSHILTRATAYLNAASFLLLSGVLLFQILGEGLLTSLRPVLYPRDQAEFLVLSNLLLKHRPAVLFWATACGLGGVFLIVAARKEAWGAFVRCMTVLMVISLFFVQKFDVNLANHYSFKPFVKRVLSRINDTPLYFYRSDDYGVIFYAGKRVPTLDIESLPRDNSPYYLFVWEKDWKQFTDHDGLSLVEGSENPDRMGKGRLFLVSVSKARVEKQAHGT